MQCCKLLWCVPTRAFLRYFNLYYSITMHFFKQSSEIIRTRGSGKVPQITKRKNDFWSVKKFRIVGLKLRFSCISDKISVNYQKRVDLIYWWGGIFYLYANRTKNHLSYRNMGVKVYFSGAEVAAKFFTPLKTIYVRIFDSPHHQISDGEACPPSIPKSWGMPLQQKFLKSVAGGPPKIFGVFGTPKTPQNYLFIAFLIKNFRNFWSFRS